jgi:hypothetical protein
LLAVLSCNQKKEKETNSNTAIATTDTTKNPEQNSEGKLLDLSKRFTVSYKAVADSDIYLEDNLRFAVIPLDSIGAIDIPWHDMKKEVTKETEKEFETELLKCIDGKDKNIESSAVTEKRPLYCEREGYSDFGGMGSIPKMHYHAFVKGNNLIIAEMFLSWSKCTTGYETKKEQKDCRDENEKKKAALRTFMDEVVKTIQVTRI